MVSKEDKVKLYNTYRNKYGPVACQSCGQGLYPEYNIEEPTETFRLMCPGCPVRLIPGLAFWDQIAGALDDSE